MGDGDKEEVVCPRALLDALKGLQLKKHVMNRSIDLGFCLSDGVECM